MYHVSISVLSLILHVDRRCPVIGFIIIPYHKNFRFSVCFCFGYFIYCSPAVKLRTALCVWSFIRFIFIPADCINCDWYIYPDLVFSCCPKIVTNCIFWAQIRRLLSEDGDRVQLRNIVSCKKNYGNCPKINNCVNLPFS
jgi:hypothetical protein